MTVRDTSLAAWHDLEGRGVLQQQERSIMLWAHQQSHAFIRKEIADALNMEKGSVAGRVNRLVKLGFLEELLSVRDKGHELRVAPMQRQLELAAA